MKKQNRREPATIEAMERRMMLDASQFTDAIVSSTLPAAASDVNVLRGKVAVSITNNSGSIQRNRIQVAIFATTAASLDLSGSDFLQLGVKPAKIKLTNGQTKTYRVNVVRQVGAIADGVYTLYAVVRDGAGATSQSAAGPTLNVTPPFVQLSETESFLKLPTSIQAGAKFNVVDKIAITNSGSDASTGALNIGVFATPDGIPADGTLIAAELKTVTVRPNKTSTVPFKLPTFPSIAAGSYQLITQITDTNGAVTTSDPAVAPSITVAAAPGGGGSGSVLQERLIKITPTLVYDFSRSGDHVDPLNVKLVLENTGTSASDGNTTFTVFASNNSTFDDTAVPVSSIVENLNIAPHQVKGMSLDFTNIENDANAQGTEIDFYVFVQVTDPFNSTTTVAYPTKVEFAD